MDLSTYKRRVCLLGSGHYWPNAPFNDPTIEIWSLGMLWRLAPRITRFYELHPFEIRRQHAADLVAWMKEKNTADGMQLVLQNPQPDLPNATEYPLRQILGRFGTYFRSSMDLMLCQFYLEIEQSGDDWSEHWLTVHGVDMAAEGEYGYQKPSFESWLKYGEGKGLNVVIPTECDLFKARGVYGYDVNADFGWRCRAKADELEQRVRSHEAKRDQAKAVGMTTAGALGAFQKLKESMNGTWPAELDAEVEKMRQMLLEAKTEADAEHECALKLRGGMELMPWVKQYA